MVAVMYNNSRSWSSMSTFSTKRGLRPFITAGLFLTFLLFCASRYLYQDGFTYHSAGPPQFVTMNGDNLRSPGQTWDPPDIHDDGAWKSTGTSGKAVENEHVVGAASPADTKHEQEVLQSDSDWSEMTTNGCPRHWEYMARVGVEQELTRKVMYTRSCIQPVFSSDTDPSEVVNVTDPIPKSTVELDLVNCTVSEVPECKPIKLKVPLPYPKATYSEFMFGMATTFERLTDSIDPIAHWISGTEAKLVAAVTDSQDKTTEEMEGLENKMRKAGIDAVLVGTLFEDYTAHFAVLEDMVEHSNEATKWFGLLDDDTFFPNLKPLADALAPLDYTTDVYAGVLSEDFGQIRIWGYMAYGGAGIYLSAPLAKKLADQVYDCINTSSARQGDIIIRECVYTRSKAKLTVIPGLHQQDVTGDASGYFEAGLRPINLHHWKTWFEAPVVAMAKAADFCGGCFLQRWRFGNDTVLTNGYSIARYRDGVASVDLGTVEGTWEKHTNDYDWSIGPIKRPYTPQEKQSFRLVEAEITPQGALRQVYVWKGNDSAGELDEVVEMIWQK